jgi:hypothetical protein
MPLLPLMFVFEMLPTSSGIKRESYGMVYTYTYKFTKRKEALLLFPHPDTQRIFFLVF